MAKSSRMSFAGPCLSWHTNPMESLNVIIRLLALSQGLLLMLFIASSANPLRVRAVGVGLIVGVLTYIVMPLVEAHTSYYEQIRYVWFLGSIVPSLLLLFVFFIFEECCEVPWWVIAVVSVSIAASLWFQLSEDGYISSPLWLQLLKAGITIAAIVIIWRGRENDLVEARSKMRTFFVLVLAVETLLVVFIEMLTHFNPPMLLDTLTQFCIFVFAITINFFFTKFNPEGQLRPAMAPTSVQGSDTVDPVIAQLLERMRDERLYADHDLRVGSLAQLINIPEYKLRQKINQELGYRNFNHFVNHYRIEEAGVKLREDARTPVLSIALDVGFRSISSFNSAFQAHFGLSPTKYRSESLPNN